MTWFLQKIAFDFHFFLCYKSYGVDILLPERWFDKELHGLNQNDQQ